MKRLEDRQQTLVLIERANRALTDLHNVDLGGAASGLEDVLDAWDAFVDQFIGDDGLFSKLPNDVPA